MFTDPNAFRSFWQQAPSPDPAAVAAARTRQAQLTKPPGSLGRLEDIACWLAGWQGTERPRVDDMEVIVFAGNHGVTRQGVSPYPADVTAQMVANFEAGGAAINAFARSVGLTLRVIPLELDRPTEDFTTAPAMTEAECLDALNQGAAAVREETDLLLLGEMGIGNTTVASALAAALFGGGGDNWVGPGTGHDAAGIARKAKVVDAALTRHRDHLDDPFELLRRLGGREIAAMAGAVMAARQKRIPVLLDGFIGTAAAAPLTLAYAGALDHCLAGHVSAEPAHRRLLSELGLTPVLDLDMRLGEGTGAALAAAIVRAAVAAHNEMATFAEAGVSDKEA